MHRYLSYVIYFSHNKKKYNTSNSLPNNTLLGAGGGGGARYEVCITSGASGLVLVILPVGNYS